MMSLHKERKQKGAFLVLFAVLLPVFLLLVALVSEIGRIWAYHTKLQNAADAAALAGAANFVNGDTIDSHPNADTFAARYVAANLGHNLTSSPNLQQFQAETKAASGSEGEKSYYRVHLEEEIPLIQATAAWLHRPTFLVKATAVALIGKEGTSGGGGIKLGKLATIGSWFDGSFFNNNGRDNDYAMLHQNKIEGAVFDGDIIIWDWQKQTQG
ncbi:MAG: pilus assembly protein TadG-related protein, partial [Acidaminococcus fermentans]|uniref:pilus assembly protein TadG-related protein n=1 Tax=Acidaminococcus fermentans TaxID=905 RepID=UPI00242F72B6